MPPCQRKFVLPGLLYPARLPAFRRDVEPGPVEPANFPQMTFCRTQLPARHAIKSSAPRVLTPSPERAILPP